MLGEDLDDDTHLCYKCRSTIVGLENYVRHRKSNCGHHKPQEEDSQQITKSSMDGTPIQMNHSYGPFDFNESTVTNESTKSITDRYGYNYGLGADLFFSSLQLQSITKDFNTPPSHHHHHHHHHSSAATTGEKMLSNRVLTRKATAAIMAHPEHEVDWIGAPQTESDKLMKAVSDISGNKKVEDMFNLIGFHPHVSDDSSEETDDDDEDDYNAPPRTHTGGKWKPASPVHHPSTSNLVHHHWSSPFEPSTSGKWKSPIDEFPPVDTTDYTQAIWMTPTYKPTEPIMEKSFPEQFWCNICNRKLASRLVYDRHLKSKFHLKRSEPEAALELAAQPNEEKLSKRFIKPSIFLNSEIYDIDFDRAKSSATITSGQVKRKSPKQVKKRLRRKNFIKCDVCKSRLPVYLLGKHLISHYHYRRMLKSSETSFEMILSNIEKIVHQSPFQCQICRFYANTEKMFMLHWNSTDHKNAITSKFNTTTQRLWCSFCKFETDSCDSMTAHLTSNNHQDTLQAINRSVPIVIRAKTILSCDICHQEFRFNFELRKHVSHRHKTDKDFSKSASDSYQSKHKCCVCDTISSSRKALQKHEMKHHGLKRYFCDLCDLVFDDRDVAKKHRTSSAHKIAVAKRNGENESLKKKCEYCQVTVADVVKLKKHIMEAHPDKKHNCQFCGENFLLAQEVSRHVREKTCQLKFPQIISTEPPMSGSEIHEIGSFEVEDLANTSLTSVSSSDLLLTIPNVVGDVSCLYSVDESISEDVSTDSKNWSCKICPYKSTLQSELIYHEILHSVVNLDKSTKISCPYCNKFFTKISLRYHLRQHTNEREFQCKICPQSFTRKSNLNAHVKIVHVDEKTKIEKINVPKTFSCTICDKKFGKRMILEQHLHTHRDQMLTKRYHCQYENCVYSGRTDADLRNHMFTHDSAKNFVCDVTGCGYKGKTKEYLIRHIKKQHKSVKTLECPHCPSTFKVLTHLKRHILTHTGDKPFKCPHCEYSCNNIENLRKHVLTTVKHRGKSIYECKSCEREPKFATNYSKEYKLHLKMKHNNHE